MSTSIIKEIEKEFDSRFHFVVEKDKRGLYRAVLYFNQGTSAEGSFNLKHFICSSLLHLLERLEEEYKEKGKELLYEFWSAYESSNDCGERDRIIESFADKIALPVKEMKEEIK